MASQRRLALAAALLLACLGSRQLQVAAYTLPDQLDLITAFRDAMLARPGQQNWTKALASWTCPTEPSNSVGGSCDPCGQQASEGCGAACKRRQPPATDARCLTRAACPCTLSLPHCPTAAGLGQLGAHCLPRPRGDLHQREGGWGGWRGVGGLAGGTPAPSFETAAASADCSTAPCLVVPCSTLPAQLSLLSCTPLCLPASHGPSHSTPCHLPPAPPYALPPAPFCPLPLTLLQVPGDGFINHVHITDYQLEGEVPLKELCPFTRLTVGQLPGRAGCVLGAEGSGAEPQGLSRSGLHASASPLGARPENPPAAFSK